MKCRCAERSSAEAGVTGPCGRCEASVLQADVQRGRRLSDGEFGRFSESDSTFTFDPTVYEAAPISGVAGRAHGGAASTRGRAVHLGGAFVGAFGAGGRPPLCTTVCSTPGSRPRPAQVIADYRRTLLDEREPLAVRQLQQTPRGAPGRDHLVQDLRARWQPGGNREGGDRGLGWLLRRGRPGDLFEDVTGFAASACDGSTRWAK